MPIVIDTGTGVTPSPSGIDPTTKTALDLVTGALRKIGQYAAGETLSSDDAQDALDTFNEMLDLWSTQKLSVFNQVETVQTLTAGQASYTIGLGGYFNIERPLRLVTAYSRMSTSGNTVDFGCQVVTLQKYTALGLKNQPGPWPKMVYYNSGFPMGTLEMWPVPQTDVEFHLWSDVVFTSLNLSDTVSLPRGYFLGLQYSLAELLCSEYGMSVPPDIKRFAHEFRSAIKALNASPTSEAPVDSMLIATNRNDAGFILTGGFS